MIARYWPALAAAVIVGVSVLVLSVMLAQTPDRLERQPSDELESTRRDDTVSYTVRDGMSAADVGEDLEVLGVIRSSRQFQSLVKLMGVEPELSAGDYVFHLGSSTTQVVDILMVRPGPEQFEIRFPEGIRIEEMAQIVEQSGIGTAEEFLTAIENAQLPPGLAENLPPAENLPEGQRLQGYLFPDTYFVTEESTPAELVRRMIDELDRRFTPEMRAAAASRGLNTHEVLTLAAIVEREAVLEEERPLIAGVFYNRIEAGDLIGADPTVQYAVSLLEGNIEEFGYWKRDLTLEDLDVESPYNTRLFPGIPPGPITNAGEASIQAVAFPEDTDFYYFVANAVEGDGSHVFAVTQAEHDRNQVEFGE